MESGQGSRSILRIRMTFSSLPTDHQTHSLGLRQSCSRLNYPEDDSNGEPSDIVDSPIATVDAAVDSQFPQAMESPPTYSVIDEAVVEIQTCSRHEEFSLEHSRIEPSDDDSQHADLASGRREASTSSQDSGKPLESTATSGFSESSAPRPAERIKLELSEKTSRRIRRLKASVSSTAVRSTAGEMLQVTRKHGNRWTRRLFQGYRRLSIDLDHGECEEEHDNSKRSRGSCSGSTGDLKG